MATKRKTYKYKHGDVIDVEEFHDGNYGAPGKKRLGKRKPTKLQMIIINSLNKAKRARQRLLAYFNMGDYLITWTYIEKQRPPNMQGALKDFERAIRRVRGQYRKRGYELFWIRNIEQGTRGAWHIHLVANKIPGAASIMEEAWDHGGTYTVVIKKSKFYDEDFTKLANYITKDENTREEKENGEPAKPRIKNANYNTSRNMPLPDPDVDKLKRWKREVKPKKGYYIAKIHEGINELGYRYRRYTMIRLHRRI